MRDRIEIHRTVYICPLSRLCCPFTSTAVLQDFNFVLSLTCDHFRVRNRQVAWMTAAPQVTPYTRPATCPPYAARCPATLVPRGRRLLLASPATVTERRHSRTSCRLSGSEEGRPDRPTARSGRAVPPASARPDRPTAPPERCSWASSMPDCVVVNPANRATAGRQPAAGGPERQGPLPALQEGQGQPQA